MGLGNRGLVSLALLLALLLGACATAPISGRRQLRLVSDTELSSLSAQEYDKFLKENKLSDDAMATAMVKRVGARISRAAVQYFEEKGQAGYLDGYDWRFELIKDDTINAWCMPGGRVVFYTGILPVTKDEAGLAVVMAHEISHAVAAHGNERMSQSMLVNLGATALSKALTDKPELTQQLFLGAFGAGANLGVLLPFSREHEYEADYLGLIFMARAGYNPQAAIEFWGRMSALGGSKTPAYLGTHPSNEDRIKKLESRMPEAMEAYKKTGK
jgi:predicted Zn-dependent protease